MLAHCNLLGNLKRPETVNQYQTEAVLVRWSKTRVHLDSVAELLRKWIAFKCVPSGVSLLAQDQTKWPAKEVIVNSV